MGFGAHSNVFHQMRILVWLEAFFALPAVLASDVCYTGKTVDRSATHLVPTKLPIGFSWAMFFCQNVTDHCTLAESAESPLFGTPPLLGSEHGMGLLGFRWSIADNFGVLARGANCTNVHLARLIAGVQKACLDVHDTSLASGSADVFCYEVSPANSYCSGTGKLI